MSDSQFKVTDKRMFTADGELKEEYSFLDTPGGSETPEEASPKADPPPRASPEPSGPIQPPGPSAGARAPRTPEPVEAAPGPGFLDLVGMLAEPVPYYLGEAPLPNGTVREDLQMARVHIDLLDVLRQKTAGNLTAEESSVLEDILYQLRMRYVQKGG